MIKWFLSLFFSKPKGAELEYLILSVLKETLEQGVPCDNHLSVGQIVYKIVEKGNRRPSIIELNQILDLLLAKKFIFSFGDKSFYITREGLHEIVKRDSGFIDQEDYWIACHPYLLL